MKKILLVLLPILLLFLTVFFISCDYLLPAPLGRNNPFDYEAQIGRFNAAASGSDSIETAWDWRSPPVGIEDSRIIDKIRIVHKENNPPDTKYPLNLDNVIEIDTNSTWQYSWNGLNTNSEHYFALYAHEKGGMWLAPKHVDLHLDNNGYAETTGVGSGHLKMYVDTSVPTNNVSFTLINISGPQPGGIIGFLVFDELFNGEFGAVLSSQLDGYGFTTSGEIDIVPMRMRIEDGMPWTLIGNDLFYDYEHSKTVDISNAAVIINIKDQINIARVYGSNTVAFIPSQGSTINIDISTTYFSNFSVWRNN